MEYDYNTLSIVNVTHGVIAQQVNCKNKIGAGVSGDIIRKYPKVRVDYENLFKKHPAPFGKIQLIRVTNDLIVANIFSQYDYGNSERTGKVYTDENVLVNSLNRLCKKFSNTTVYISFRIGCGLAGGNWNIIENGIKENENLVVVVPKVF